MATTTITTFCRLKPSESVCRSAIAMLLTHPCQPNSDFEVTDDEPDVLRVTNFMGGNYTQAEAAQGKP